MVNFVTTAGFFCEVRMVLLVLTGAMVGSFTFITHLRLTKYAERFEIALAEMRINRIVKRSQQY